MGCGGRGGMTMMVASHVFWRLVLDLLTGWTVEAVLLGLGKALFANF